VVAVGSVFKPVAHSLCYLELVAHDVVTGILSGLS
jgi:hypothetical protein